jgi:O-antigen/teichoic acid export membrane protein
MSAIDPAELRQKAATGGSLRGPVMRGLGWKVSSQVFTQVSRIVVALILARLLSPHDFGLASMVFVFSALILIFSDLSLGAALVQRARLGERDRSTVFWTSFSAGIIFCLVGVGLAGPVAAFYGEPAVKPLFIAMSLGFIPVSLATTQSALLTREMNFRALEVRTMIATAAGAAIGISAAVRGYGAWALIAQQLATGVAGTALIWIVSPWRPRLVFSLASLKDLGGFGLNLFVARLLFYLNRNVDNLLIGRFLGAAPLGAYALAYNVMLLPLNRLSSPIQSVLFPALSQIQDQPERIADIWFRVTRVVAAVTVPAMLGLIVVAPDAIPLLIGAKWAAAVPVIQILAWVGMLQSLATLHSKVLTALDKTGTLVRFSAVGFVVNITAFVLGLRWGIVGVATAYALASTFLVPFITVLTARAAGASAWQFARSLTGVLQAGAVMFVVVLGTRLLLLDQGMARGGRLAIVIAVGVATFAAMGAWRAREVVDEVKQIRRRSPAVAAS